MMVIKIPISSKSTNILYDNTLLKFPTPISTFGYAQVYTFLWEFKENRTKDLHDRLSVT